MSGATKSAAFTIVARNYVAFARSWLLSIAEFEPSIDRFVFIIDDLEGIEHLEEGTALTPMEVFSYETYMNLAYGYDIMELSTAVKPSVLRYLLGRGYDRVFYFDPDIQVFAALEPVRAPLDDHDLVITPHTTEAIPLDGELPDEVVLLRAGAYNLGFIGVSNTASARAMLDWWAERLKTMCVSDVNAGLFVDQKWIDLVPGLVERTSIVRHRGCNVAYWNLHSRHLDTSEQLVLVSGEPVIFFHFSGFDVRHPERLSKYQTRIQVKDEPRLERLLKAYSQRVTDLGHLERLKIPYRLGKFSNDASIDHYGRALLRQAAADGLQFPDPSDVAAEPSAWAYLNEPITRYTLAVARNRSDVRAAFPDVLGSDRKRFAAWLHADPSIDPAYLSNGANGPARSWGVNVAGYFRTESGVGESGRAQVSALRAAGTPVELLDFSEHAPSRREDQTIAGAGTFGSGPVNLVCVNADQVPHFVSTAGTALFQGRYNIGSWWWELPEFPERWTGAFQYFDEIWAGSQFVATALGRKSPVPVVLIPPVVDVGDAHAVPRSNFDLHDDETVFLFMFDFYSIFDRKNPLAVIEAFRQAFTGSEAVRLVMKSINSEHDPAGLRRIQEAIGGDERICIIDRYLSRFEKNCLLATCDAYVSLHRSEGFGYTLAEAMALGRPVIATAWSGNADYLTPSNGYPVGYRLVELETASGPYDAGQVWAEPDVGDAVAAMRSVYERPYEARRRGERAREEMTTRYAASAVGRIIRARLDRIEVRLGSRKPT